MKRILTLALVALLGLAAMAQKGYRATYRMTIDFGDRLSGQFDEATSAAIAAQMNKMKNFYILSFADGRSFFELDVERTDNPAAATMSGHSVFVDMGEGKVVSQEVFFGHQFLIEEQLEPVAWTIDTEQRTIAGYRCTRATVGSDEHPLTAWFATEVPIPSGPMGYWGLPGLIVQLEVEGMAYTLTELNVVDNPKPITAPTKGKKVSRDEFQQIVQEKLEQMGGLMGGSMQMIQMN